MTHAYVGVGIRQGGFVTPTTLPDSTILVVEVGSTAHGTGIPGGEDLDEIGVWVESPEQVFGPTPPGESSMHRTQPDGVRSGPGDIDLTLHPLRKFLRLASQGNPSILMAMWSPVMMSVPVGEQLRELAPSFIGRHVIPRYRGYMYSQCSRLLGIGGGSHGKRGGGQRPELIDAYGYDTKYGMHASRLGFQCLELLRHGKLEFPMEGANADWLRSVRSGEVDFQEWWDVTLNLDAECEKLESDWSIPPGPDLVNITRWASAAHLTVWENMGL